LFATNPYALAFYVDEIEVRQVGVQAGYFYGE
jgi:hypothetical protein